VTILDVEIGGLSGGSADLAQYRGNALLIVNVASRCGLTPQYAGLQQLSDRYADRGLVVIGVPCNQFGGQEPGDARQIEQFCASQYDVTFPLFAKIDVNGSKAHPLYSYLKSEKTGLLGSSIKWNFTKFLVDRSGKVTGRFAPTVTPDGLKKEIEALL